VDPHEERTVKAFIIRVKRPRYLLCLNDQSKRRKKLDKLNYCADLDPRFVEWLPKHADVVSMLREAGSPEDVHVISFAQEIDGKTLPLDDAVHQTEMCGWGTILSFVPGRLAYFYDEYGHRHAILKR